MAKGGKVGRKEGYKKPDESFQEEYATVIKQLRKGYPIRMIAKNCGVGISSVQRIKKKFIGNEQNN
jgi:transposase